MYRFSIYATRDPIRCVLGRFIGFDRAVFQRPVFRSFVASGCLAFPPPTLAKAGGGAVHGDQILWHDHAARQPAPPLFIVSNS